MTRERIAIVPYWISDNPHVIEDSDHHWWLSHLKMFDVIVYFGPYIATDFSSSANKKIVSIRTASLHIDLQLVFECHLNAIGITPEDIGLYWHVIEVASTCRVRGAQ